MNNQELFKIIKKPWADTKDIMALAGCTRQGASKIRNALYGEAQDEGKKIPTARKLVSMKRLVKYLGIDENRIIKYAKAEKEV